MSDSEILAAARALVKLWRDPDPDSWRHVDEVSVVAAIERLCAAVERREG